MTPDTWSTFPPAQRAIVRAYVNSENEDDRDRALALCRRYGLDYAAMRRVILDEMIAESRRLGRAWVPAAGSRPLSNEQE